MDEVPAGRFWEKVQKTEDCWYWLASKDGKGYGLAWFQGRLHRAHRVAWFLEYGAVPLGLCVCHHCDNAGCVNPAHLFLGSRADNNKDMLRKGHQAHVRGQQNGRAKLTLTQVLDIRGLKGKAGPVALARRYGVDHRTIGRIWSGEKWKETNA